MEWLFNRKDRLRDQLVKELKDRTGFNTSKSFRPNIFFVEIDENRIIAYNLVNRNNIIFVPTLSSLIFQSEDVVYLRNVEEVENHIKKLEEKEVKSTIRKKLVRRAINYTQHLYQYLSRQLQDDTRFEVSCDKGEVVVSLTGLPYVVLVRNISYGKLTYNKFELQRKRRNESGQVVITEVRDLGSIITALEKLREAVDEPVETGDIDIPLESYQESIDRKLGQVSPSEKGPLLCSLMVNYLTYDIPLEHSLFNKYDIRGIFINETENDRFELPLKGIPYKVIVRYEYDYSSQSTKGQLYLVNLVSNEIESRIINSSIYDLLDTLEQFYEIILPINACESMIRFLRELPEDSILFNNYDVETISTEKDEFEISLAGLPYKVIASYKYNLQSQSVEGKIDLVDLRFRMKKATRIVSDSTSDFQDALTDLYEIALERLNHRLGQSRQPKQRWNSFSRDRSVAIDDKLFP